MPTVLDIIAGKAPEYAANEAAWAKDEVRYRAGRAVRGELTRFPWEPEGGTDIAQRQSRAVAPPLMRTTAERFTGSLFESAPEVDWGDLGDVRTERTGDPTPAEQVYDATDGVGYDARGWDAFWRDEMAAATATGWRWIWCEAPPALAGERTPSRADEIAGQRPYLVALSPLAVPDWHYERGVLQYVRIVSKERAPLSKTADVTRHLVMVRRGYSGLNETGGVDYSLGGWWEYDDKGTQLASGTWEKTEGEIPMTRLVYDRSGEGLSDLGAVQAACMDLLSALYYDGIVGGGHGMTVVGGDPAGYAVYADLFQQGSRLRAFPVPEGVTAPLLHDDAAASASGAITEALDRHLKIAADTIAREMTTAPDASGAARQIEYAEGASPRLTAMAIAIEEAQNIALRFLQMRFGKKPSGGVTWPRRYDLTSVAAKVAGALDVLTKAQGVGPVAPDYVADLVVRHMEREGLMGDTNANDLRASLVAAFGDAASASSLAARVQAANLARVEAATVRDAAATDTGEAVRQEIEAAANSPAA